MECQRYAYLRRAASELKMPAVNADYIRKCAGNDFTSIAASLKTYRDVGGSTAEKDAAVDKAIMKYKDETKVLPEEFADKESRDSTPLIGGR